MNHETKAKKNYQEFHGRGVQRQTRVPFTMPRALTFLGDGVAIEYASNKKLNGTNAPRTYRHKFGKSVKIYLHPNKRVLIVMGGRFSVTDWMRY